MQVEQILSQPLRPWPNNIVGMAMNNNIKLRIYEIRLERLRERISDLIFSDNKKVNIKSLSYDDKERMHDKLDEEYEEIARLQLQKERLIDEFREFLTKNPSLEYQIIEGDELNRFFEDLTKYDASFAITVKLKSGGELVYGYIDYDKFKETGKLLVSLLKNTFEQQEIEVGDIEYILWDKDIDPDGKDEL